MGWMMGLESPLPAQPGKQQSGGLLLKAWESPMAFGTQSVGDVGRKPYFISRKNRQPVRALFFNNIRCFLCFWHGKQRILYHICIANISYGNAVYHITNGDIALPNMISYGAPLKTALLGFGRIFCWNMRFENPAIHKVFRNIQNSCSSKRVVFRGALLFPPKLCPTGCPSAPPDTPR